MKILKATFVTELLKLRNSKIVWITFLFFLFIPMMMGLMFYIQMHPELIEKLGIIGTKASLLKLGKAEWPAFLGFLIQGMAGIGLIGFGFVTSWVFGREFSDRTMKDILALPVLRSSIVFSKFIVVGIWCILLSVVYFVFSLIFGNIIGITGWSSKIISQNTYTYSMTSLLTILLCPAVAFFASTSRGYLLPMAFVILTMIMANFTGILGLGPYFPWAIPGLFGVAEGSAGMQLTAVSYIILFSTSAVGLVGTLAWWRFADHK